MVPVGSGEQWTGFAQVWSVQRMAPNEAIITVAVEIFSTADVRRLVYLAVPVAYGAGGWVVHDYPAFVPPPVKGAPTNRPEGEGVADNGQRGLLNGFFKAVMSGAPAEIAAYMAPGQTPPPGFSGAIVLRDMADMQLYRTVDPAELEAVVTLHVQDPATQGIYRQRYHVTLTGRDGRWYVKTLTPGS